MFVFPLHRFCPGSFSADIVARVISGGTAINGDETAIETDRGGRWQGSLGDIDLDDPYLMRLWDAWTSHFAGGARPFLMPVPLIDAAPGPVNGYQLAWPSDIRDDDDFFPTETRFATAWIEAKAVGDADVATITIDVERGSRLTPGMRFGAGNRSYKIHRITARSGQQATCILSTPVRETIEDGAALNFDWPLVQCKITVGQNLSPQYVDGYATVGFSFVEDFTDAE